MGFFNNHESTPDEIEKEYADILAENEHVEHAHKLGRDRLVFTNMRLLVIDVQGLTGKKVVFQSVPYRSITYFYVEMPGSSGTGGVLKIRIVGPDEMSFENFTCIRENFNIIQRLLTKYTAIN